MNKQKIRYDDSMLSKTITAEQRQQYSECLSQAERMLIKGTGPGADFLGWLDLPQRMLKGEVKKITEKAEEIRSIADTLVCIGIGGSYLGARAAIEFLGPSFDELKTHRVVYAGHHINSDFMADLLAFLEQRNVAVNVISKSGTTTEPAIAFRVIKNWMEKRYGKNQAAKRIIATTDASKGALRSLANELGYTTFNIDDNVGGRFSVLSPVGLFPIAFAGIDISALCEGAAEATEFCSGTSLNTNMAAAYAVNRNILFRKGKCLEVMATFQPQFHFIGEWFKQLSAESEGKNGTGIFPALLDYTTDLHSLGQWMQEGLRIVFETFVVLQNTVTSVHIPLEDNDRDGLNYLADKSFELVNDCAFKATLLAHIDGGVPCSLIEVESRTPQALGQLFYFYEKAIALSGYLLRVNPFDQPGVEAYKKNMFALLGKTGFESGKKELIERLKELGI